MPYVDRAIVVPALLALVAAGCTHDFGAFVVDGDAAIASDASGVSDAPTATDAGADVAKEASVNCGGAVQFGGHCYFTAGTNGSFDASRAACVAMGAHLVTLGSPAEQAAVAPIAIGQDRWIGLERAADAGATSASSFMWIDGEPSVYTNWATGEPSGSDRCVRMKTDGTWGDQTCSMSLAAICEFE